MFTTRLGYIEDVLVEFSKGGEVMRMMKMALTGGVLAVCLLPASLSAEPRIVVTQGEEADLGATFSSIDLIQGLIPQALPGDRGWHPANTDPADQLPAFTDGAGMRATGLTGLLNDFPPAGEPTKLIRYDLPLPVDVEEVRVFTGNKDRDGRVFHTYTIAFSSDGGETFSPEIYVQSHPSGTINNTQFNQWRVVLSRVTDTSGRLATRVNSIRFHFYAADNSEGQTRDPFNGVNPYTGRDDGFNAPISSPLIWEIDVFGVPSEICDNGIDDDGDGDVDCLDSDCTGSSECTCNDPFADADGDNDVDQSDFGIFQSCYGGEFGGILTTSPYCHCFDRDYGGQGDGDVDMEDFNAFIACLSGPMIPADPACDDN